MFSETLIKLIDNDSYFTIVTDKIKVDISYSSFALALVNVNFENMRKTIVNYVQSNRYTKLSEELAQHFAVRHTMETEIADMVFADLEPQMLTLFNYVNLSETQAKAIAHILVQEIKNKFISGDVDLSNPATYFPEIYTYKELYTHIRNSLLMKQSTFSNELQQEINQLGLTSAIIILDDGTPVNVYYLENTFSYLIVDIQKYLLSVKRVKECECCGRLFYPKYRKTERYCRLSHANTQKKCNEIMQHSTDDDFTKLAKSARGYQSSRCTNASTLAQYDEKVLKNLYKEWSKECSKKCKYYRKKKNIDGFKAWIDKTKFTAEYLGKKLKPIKKT